jgi:peptide methionine sulfoxide reductase msrA/msrB
MKAIFASGCFWGTEYWFMKAQGVTKTTVGYIGGHLENPTYQQVCTGLTGHLEATEVLYNPQETNFESLCKLFFETHNFEQTNGQGPDIGSQYLSAIFYADDEQYNIAKKLIAQLTEKGYTVATKLYPESIFYAAENYHQQYYENKGTTPYCHSYIKIF